MDGSQNGGREELLAATSGFKRLGEKQKRRPRIGFGTRLALTLSLTLVGVAALGYEVSTRAMRNQLIAQEAAYQRAEAKQLGAAAAGKSWSRGLPELATLLDAAP